jgi:hypothetical protein
MKRMFLSLFIIFFVFLYICSPKDDYPLIREIINGIPVLTNPDYPKNLSNGYNLKEVLSIGVEEGDENYNFFRIAAVEVDEEDNIYVLDAGNGRIQVFNEEGKYLKTIGQKGQGPGDLLRPNSLSVNLSGKIYIYDDSNLRITIFKINGEYIGDFKIQYPAYSDIFSDEDQNLFFNISAGFKDHNGPEGYIEGIRILKIVKYSETGKELVSFGEFSGFKSQYYQIKGLHIAGLGTDELQTVWTVDQKGNVYIADANKYEITVYSKIGNAIKKIKRKFDQIEYTSKEIKDFINRERNRNVPQYIKKRLIFSRYKIAIKSITVDEKGNLWVNTSQKGDADGYAFDIFNPDGIYADRVVLAEKPRLFKKGFVYTRTSFFDGTEKIKKCRLVPKSN